MRRLHRNHGKHADVTPGQRREFQRRIWRTVLAMLIFVTSFPQSALLAGGCSGSPPPSPNPSTGGPPCSTCPCTPDYGFGGPNSGFGGGFGKGGLGVCPDTSSDLGIIERMR